MKRKSFSEDEQSELLKRARELEAVPTAFFEAATRAVAKRGPAYKTPVFKCLEDFEKCKKHSNRHLCNALMAICVGKQLIPFTK
jgi:hypothetical protein